MQPNELTQDRIEDMVLYITSTSEVYARIQTAMKELIINPDMTIFEKIKMWTLVAKDGAAHYKQHRRALYRTIYPSTLNENFLFKVAKELSKYYNPQEHLTKEEMEQLCNL